MKNVIVSFGAFVVFIAYFPLYFAIIKKTVRPRLSSWVVWSAILFILLGSQIAAGKKDPWGVVAATIGNALVVILLLFYGEKKWRKFDTLCCIFVVITMAIWVFSDAATAQIASLVAFTIAGIPTVKNVWDNPGNESRLAWGMFSAGFFLTAVGVQDWSAAANWIQPVDSAAFNILIFILTLKGRESIRSFSRRTP